MNVDKVVLAALRIGAEGFVPHNCPCGVNSEGQRSHHVYCGRASRFVVASRYAPRTLQHQHSAELGLLFGRHYQCIRYTFAVGSVVVLVAQHVQLVAGDGLDRSTQLLCACVECNAEIAVVEIVLFRFGRFDVTRSHHNAVLRIERYGVVHHSHVFALHQCALFVNVQLRHYKAGLLCRGVVVRPHSVHHSLVGYYDPCQQRGIVFLLPKYIEFVVQQVLLLVVFVGRVGYTKS